MTRNVIGFGLDCQSILKSRFGFGLSILRDFNWIVNPKKWIEQQPAYRGTVASVVIQAIGSGTNEETLMKATQPMIKLGQFGTCTKHRIG
jgi:hypothetical protein